MKSKEITKEGMTGSRPRITIITATFNAVESLPVTAKSIREQTYDNIQWIVADGGSKDGTVDLLKEWHWVKWFSEKDNGIYDAWNKALRLADGDWIQFIGAGDYLAGPEVIEQMVKILEACLPDHRLVYGNIQYVSLSSGRVLETVVRPWEKIKDKWEFLRPKLPVHPEVFHHETLFVGDSPFSTKYRIASDSHFLLKSLRVTTPRYVNLLIDVMPVGGVSWGLVNQKMIDELLEISKELGIPIPRMHYIFAMTTLFAKKLLLKVLGEKLTYRIADRYRRLRGLDPRWTVQ